MTKQTSDIPSKPKEPETKTVCNQPCCQPKTILLVIIGLLVIAGAVYAGIQISKKENPPTPPLLKYPTPTSTTSTPDETINWKTYRNEKYGFEFKYPFLDENMVVEKEPISDLGTIISQQFGKEDYGYKFSLIVYLNKNKFDLKTFYEKMSNSRQFYEGLIFDEKFVSSIKQISNGQNVYYFKDGYCVSLCDKYVWSRDEMVYEFINFHPEIPQDNIIFDQILSTFKFTDSQSSSN